MSPREAAAATGINRLTILKWIKSGRLAAESIRTRNGPGYEIRPEDLTQALRVPRKKRDPAPEPVKGSVVAEMQALRTEVHDLRGQMFQMEQRLQDAIHAISRVPPAAAPEAAREERRGSLFSRRRDA